MTTYGHQMELTRNSIDGTVSFLKYMEENNTFAQWATYLLEAIETEIGIEALKEVGTLLDSRLYEHGSW